MAIIDLDKALSDVYGFGKEKVNIHKERNAAFQLNKW